MRFIKLGIYPPAYLQTFYARQPGLEKESYVEQHRRLTEDRFGSSDFWTRALSRLGYDTLDLIANAEHLQNRWAFENNFNCEGQDHLFEIALAQIEAFRPEVLLVADYSTLTAEFIKTVRRKCPSIRLILGWCGAPYRDLSVIREWDAVLSCVPEMVESFRTQGMLSFHVNHAFEPRILSQLIPDRSPTADFIFTGTIFKSESFHLEREKLLIYLIENTDLEIWSGIRRPASLKNNIRTTARRQLQKLVKTARRAGVPDQLLKSIPLVRRAGARETPAAIDQEIDGRIARRTLPPLFGLEMFQKLHDSRVVFNNHIDISPISASNMRLFEATGTGACLITDWKKNLPELFEPGTEVLTYKTAEECAEKVKYILEHEDERRKIAAAGQRRTLRDHTFENRALLLDEIIKKLLDRKS